MRVTVFIISLVVLILAVMEYPNSQLCADNSNSVSFWKLRLPHNAHSIVLRGNNWVEFKVTKTSLGISIVLAHYSSDGVIRFSSLF